MPTPTWPKAMHPPIQYRTCWRCGGTTSAGSKPRLCRDCRPIVSKESAMWERR